VGAGFGAGAGAGGFGAAFAGGGVDAVIGAVEVVLVLLEELAPQPLSTEIDDRSVTRVNALRAFEPYPIATCSLVYV
jgi:hypothetical protein